MWDVFRAPEESAAEDGDPLKGSCRFGPYFRTGVP